MTVESGERKEGFLYYSNNAGKGKAKNAAFQAIVDNAAEYRLNALDGSMLSRLPEKELGNILKLFKFGFVIGGDVTAQWVLNGVSQIDRVKPEIAIADFGGISRLSKSTSGGKKIFEKSDAYISRTLSEIQTNLLKPYNYVPGQYEPDDSGEIHPFWWIIIAGDSLSRNTLGGVELFRRRSLQGIPRILSAVRYGLTHTIKKPSRIDAFSGTRQYTAAEISVVKSEAPYYAITPAGGNGTDRIFMVGEGKTSITPDMVARGMYDAFYAIVQNYFGNPVQYPYGVFSSYPVEKEEDGTSQDVILLNTSSVSKPVSGYSADSRLLRKKWTYMRVTPRLRDPEESKSRSVPVYVDWYAKNLKM